jgi:hypothetical protein
MYGPEAAYLLIFRGFLRRRFLRFLRFLCYLYFLEPLLRSLVPRFFVDSLQGLTRQAWLLGSGYPGLALLVRVDRVSLPFIPGL